MLSLDGGGTWGRLSLEIINVVQDIIGPSVKFQDLFDVVYGTSVGEFGGANLFVRGFADISVRRNYRPGLVSTSFAH